MLTQAWMELGERVCIPNGTPHCEDCPVRALCLAHAAGAEEEYPVRSAKKPRRIELLTVLVIRDGTRTVLHRRPDRGLLAGLFELPNVQGHLGEDAVLTYLRSIGMEPLRIRRIDDAKHIFTHLEWHMIAYEVQISPDFDGLPADTDMLLVPNRELHRRYAIPSAFSAYKKILTES